ncbi:MAG: hypothetical protein LBJ35_06085 [Spirochaetaceae bacterium]|jgi:hypothetical protein|nr:hypothetical protein [Spirochaetaceae bacterium]
MGFLDLCLLFMGIALIMNSVAVILNGNTKTTAFINLATGSLFESFALLMIGNFIGLVDSPVGCNNVVDIRRIRRLRRIPHISPSFETGRV